jgi:hypothetical protein
MRRTRHKRDGLTARGMTSVKSPLEQGFGNSIYLFSTVGPGRPAMFDSVLSIGVEK